MKRKISAGIVLFNPDEKRLNENINAVVSQVDRIILMDNGSENIRNIEEQYKEYPNIYILKNKKNLGIAKALNQILDFCRNDEWVLTLDQDSICPLDLLVCYKPYMHHKNVAILTPYIQDRNLIEKNEKPQKKTEVLDKCITSASLMKVSVWKEIGGFDERMFIDLVDFDYCYMAREKGYVILRVNDAVLLHELGNGNMVRFLGIPMKVSNHSAFRNYYYARNSIYFFKKHHAFFSLFRMWTRIGKIILFEEDKKNKLHQAFKGMRDGIMMKNRTF